MPDHEEEDVGRFTVRLNIRDVDEIKRRAAKTGATWVGYLRVLVRDALSKKETIR